VVPRKAASRTAVNSFSFRWRIAPNQKGPATLPASGIQGFSRLRVAVVTIRANEDTVANQMELIEASSR
jgi:hypothetical protein